MRLLRGVAVLGITQLIGRSATTLALAGDQQWSVRADPRSSVSSKRGPTSPGKPASAGWKRGYYCHLATIPLFAGASRVWSTAWILQPHTLGLGRPTAGLDLSVNRDGRHLGHHPSPHRLIHWDTANWGTELNGLLTGGRQPSRLQGQTPARPPVFTYISLEVLPRLPLALPC